MQCILKADCVLSYNNKKLSYIWKEECLWPCITINLDLFLPLTSIMSCTSSFGLPWADRQTADTPSHDNVEVKTDQRTKQQCPTSYINWRGSSISCSSRQEDSVNTRAAQQMVSLKMMRVKVDGVACARASPQYQLDPWENMRLGAQQQHSRIRFPITNI